MWEYGKNRETKRRYARHLSCFSPNGAGERYGSLTTPSAEKYHDFERS